MLKQGEAERESSLQLDSSFFAVQFCLSTDVDCCVMELETRL